MTSQKKRLGIFVFYDPDGIVDEYVIYLLKSLKSVLSELIIVVNGNIDYDGLNRLRSISLKVFIRENRGFDAGAYKDAIIKYLHEDVTVFDELVLCNDTFYGPFYNFEIVFEKMEPLLFDFWGLSRHAGGGRVLGHGMEILPHVQGYFIVINKRLLSDSCFINFFKKLEYPNSYREAIEKFEMGFTLCFDNKGFRYGDYAEVCGWKTLPNKSNYIQCADVLCKNFHFPVLKKKAMSITNFIAAKKVLDYLRTVKEYDVGLISENYEREKQSRRKSLRENDIAEFYSLHKSVYVWGTGDIGKNVASFLLYKNYKIAGLLNSQNYRKMYISDEDGIILALGRNACSEVLPLVKESFSEQQLLLPNYA